MSNGKTLSNITDPLSIHKAIDEFDKIGRKKFLSKYGFGSRANYFILHNGKHYDSKAIVGVAHKFARPDLGPLPPSRFSGGKNRVIVLLDKLGFKSVNKSDKEIPPRDNPEQRETILDLIKLSPGRSFRCMEIAKLTEQKFKNKIAKSKVRELLWDCPEIDQYELEKERVVYIGHPQDKSSISTELAFRLELWGELKSKYGSPCTDVPPKFLNDKKIFFGGRGIWRDKQRTSLISPNADGIAMGLLHTGAHYSDDLSETNIIYHYPETEGTSTDEGEISSVKNAHSLGLPLFVVSKNTPSSNLRNVHLGWVENWDDGLKQFLITFSDGPIKAVAHDDDDGKEFKLKSPNKEKKQTQRNARPGQQKFRFDVFKRYKYKADGKTKCALTGLPLCDLLDAAHLYPKSKNGTDNARNGLPLSPTVHRALDQGLIGICPDDFSIHGNPEVLNQLGVQYSDLNHLSKKPAAKALKHLWKLFEKSNNA